MTTTTAASTTNTIPQTIWLLRHSIREDLNQRPESDCSITNEGVALAQSRADIIAQKIVALSNGAAEPVFDCVYVSPYKRTLETTYAVLSRVESRTAIQIDSRVAETLTDYYGNCRGVQLPLPLALFLSANGIQLPETLEQVQARIRSLVYELLSLDFRNALICTHAGVLSELVRAFVPSYDVDSLGRGYCSCVALRYDEKKCKWAVADTF
jgi:broad specificity phosphatase PhoE